MTALETKATAPLERTCIKCGKQVKCVYLEHVGAGQFQHRIEFADECTGFEKSQVELGELKVSYVYDRHGKGRYQ